MAIYIHTDDPHTLHQRFTASICNHEIITWGVDKDGDYGIMEIIRLTTWWLKGR